MITYHLESVLRSLPPQGSATLAGEGCDKTSRAASSASTLSSSVPGISRPFPLLVTRGADRSVTPFHEPSAEPLPSALATGVEPKSSADFIQARA